MIIENVEIEGVKIITPEPFFDERGSFSRVFCQKEMSAIKSNLIIEQVNHSLTKKKGTIRGLHFQYPPHVETKIVRCTRGKIFDVCVDVRKGSKTFLKWYGEVLSAENQKVMLVPDGFAHGFQALEDDSEMIYFNTACYCKDAENVIRYNDPKVNIQWPAKITVVSQKDASYPDLDENFCGVEIQYSKV